MIVDPGTGGVYTLSIRDRSNSQELESEARVQKTRVTESEEKRSTNKKRNPRKNNPVEYSNNDEFHKRV